LLSLVVIELAIMHLDLYKYDLLRQVPLREQVYLKTIVSCRYVEGGMGSVSLAIGNAAREHGAHIVTSAEVYMSGITPVGLSNAFPLIKWFIIIL
jgi:hypothetical protein